MERRQFVKSISTFGVFALVQNDYNTALQRLSDSPLIKPKCLKPGDKVAVVAPATNVSDPDDIRKAKEICNHYKLQAVFSNSLFDGSGYRTKARKERANELNSFFEDKSINGILCIRGGYGSPEILDLLDYELIRNNPKVFAGYSDITAIHLAIQKFSRLVTFHSPVLLSSFSDFTASSFEKSIFNNSTIGVLQNPAQKIGIRQQFPVRTIKSGIAKGKLTGGYLSIISSLMGTPFEIDTKDKILFLEDVAEEPFRIDRMLNQLRLAGKFNQVKGIVFGFCSDCTMKSSPPTWDLQLGDVLDKYFSSLSIPSFYGLMFGHTNEQLTLPYSIEAILDADAGTLLISESATI